eukprot:c40174_g1_i1.p1 GENE.c40174_g1_i1~~c40174_g1_i1.p1  ORF type:complete len:112 (-),score=26.83 c40174_g1_i1:214-549(-)
MGTLNQTRPKMNDDLGGKHTMIAISNIEEGEEFVLRQDDEGEPMEFRGAQQDKKVVTRADLSSSGQHENQPEESHEHTEAVTESAPPNASPYRSFAAAKNTGFASVGSKFK